MDILHRLANLLDNSSIPWKSLILTFSISQYICETYLSSRQYSILQKKRVPSQLSSEVDQTTFDKSQAYGRAKAQFGFVSSFINQAKSLAVVYYDVYPKFWAIAGLLTKRILPAFLHGEIAHSLMFIFASGIIETILSLPLSYYHHFILEEKFGFNKQTVNLWLMDMLKNQGIMFAFGTPLGWAFLKIVQKTGDRCFLYLWIFALVVQMSVMTIYPIVIIPLFNKLEPLKPGTLKDAVEALAAKLKFPLDELQVIDGSKRSAHSNAYFTGLPWKKKIVIYDTLLEKSSEKEVEAVLGHELGHWKRGHTTKLLAIVQTHLLSVFTLFSVFIHNQSLYRSFGFVNEQPILIGFLLFNEVLSPTDSILKLVMNILTRKMEFEADQFALDLGYKDDLAKALINLQLQNLSSMDADWMYSSYHYSHPILTERLKALGWTSKNSKVLKEEEKTSAKTTGRSDL